MLPDPPAIYRDVFLMPTGSATEAAVGGAWTQPDLSLSYLLAARHVIAAGQRDSHLSEVAVPAAYLQRHALEVALKASLATAYTIEMYYRWAALLENEPKAKPPDPRMVPNDHSHLRLLDLLKAVLNENNLEALPSEVAQLCADIAKQEAGAPERYRYHRVRRGGKVEDAFPQIEVLPIADMQRVMEDVFERCFHFDPFKNSEQETWNGRLAYQAFEIGREVEMSTWE